jgi:hypothetical protein
MRLPIAVAIAAAFAVPGTTWCAKAPPNMPAEKTDRPHQRQARNLPRNPVDRSASDPGAGTFKSFDVNNNDGYMSRDEAKDRRAEAAVHDARQRRGRQAVDVRGNRMALCQLQWRNSRWDRHA